MNIFEFIRRHFDRNPELTGQGLSHAIGEEERSYGNKILKGLRQVKADELPGIFRYIEAKPGDVLEFLGFRLGRDVLARDDVIEATRALKAQLDKPVFALDPPPDLFARALIAIIDHYYAENRAGRKIDMDQSAEAIIRSHKTIVG